MVITSGDTVIDTAFRKNDKEIIKNPENMLVKITIIGKRLRIRVTAIMEIIKIKKNPISSQTPLLRN